MAGVNEEQGSARLVPDGFRWDGGPPSDPIADIRLAMASASRQPAEPVYWIGGGRHPQRALDAYVTVEMTQISVETACAKPDVARFFATIDRLFAQVGAAAPTTVVTLEGPIGAPADGIATYGVRYGAPIGPCTEAYTMTTWRARLRYTPAQRRREARQHGRGRRLGAYRPREEVRVYALPSVSNEARRSAALLVLAKLPRDRPAQPGGSR